MTKEDVLIFLRSYTDHFQLREHIKFHSLVENIAPFGQDQWKVKSIDIEDGVEHNEIFDAIFICNGHYSTPKIPKIEGIEHFGGHILHSRDYRTPDAFKGNIRVISTMSIRLGDFSNRDLKD